VRGHNLSSTPVEYVECVKLPKVTIRRNEPSSVKLHEISSKPWEGGKKERFLVNSFFYCTRNGKTGDPSKVYVRDEEGRSIKRNVKRGTGTKKSAQGGNGRRSCQGGGQGGRFEQQASMQRIPITPRQTPTSKFFSQLKTRLIRGLNERIVREAHQGRGGKKEIDRGGNIILQGQSGQVTLGRSFIIEESISYDRAHNILRQGGLVSEEKGSLTCSRSTEHEPAG